jgi:predicted MPP superfamily phosphohydrolase
MILLPGDFVNSPYGSDGVYVEPGAIAEILGTLRAPCGVHATLGNHDFYHGPGNVAEPFYNAGVNVLHNESVMMEHGGSVFALVGLGDHTTRTADCRTAFSDVAKNVPVIAMFHNPYTIYEMPKEIVASVAGHTHGTQFRIVGIRQPILECPDPRLNYGLQTRVDNSVIVTSGVGTSVLPFRNTPPEVVEIIIQHGMPDGPGHP